MISPVWTHPVVSFQLEIFVIRIGHSGHFRATSMKPRRWHQSGLPLTLPWINGLPSGDFNFNHCMGNGNIMGILNRNWKIVEYLLPSGNHFHHLGITLLQSSIVSGQFTLFTIPKSEIRPIFENNNSYLFCPSRTFPFLQPPRKTS